ncbi:MAG: TetR family transcriptional regulator [Marmoricola sp.]|nr:TetR family transcriptional regulator [Marmoricola sp.]
MSVETVRVRPVAASRAPATRSRRTQAERRAESDRKLLRAAAELVVERGIEGTSFAEIGRRAGYSHGLVHTRFGSKDALVERLNDEAVQVFTARTVEAVSGAQGAEAIRLLSRVYLDLVHGEDPIARVHLLVWSEAVATASGKDRRPYRITWDRVLRSALAAMVRTGIADGSVSPSVDPDTTAVVIVGLIRGVALQLMIDPGSGSVAASRGLVLEHIDRMLVR